MLLASGQWVFHWLVFLIIPALSFLILAPLVVVVSIRALILSKKKLTNTCPHCGNSLRACLVLEEPNYPNG